MKLDRSRIRRIVWTELRNTRKYRQALHTPDVLADDERACMSAWVRVADETLKALRSEPEGKAKARFIDDLYGITRRPYGSARYVFAKSMHTLHMSEAGLQRWQDNAVFIASILAVKYGLIEELSE